MNNDNVLGYLHEDFKFFYIKDKSKLDFDYHHHDFNKIVILLDGDLTYIIEGNSYTLRPWDILLVGENQIHKPIVNPDKTYERIIFWLKPEDKLLLNCFNIAKNDKNQSLRLSMTEIKTIKDMLINIRNCQDDNSFGNEILNKALFMQFMVHINRLFLENKHTLENKSIHFDKTIDKVITFIENNLDQRLNIDSIASECYISKYYLMRKFKSAMGVSIHNYIINKRLILARTLILEGHALGEVSIKCGFNDYSTFVRSFKKFYNISPSQYSSSLNNFDDDVTFE